MAIEFIRKQALAEIIRWTFDFQAWLPSGVVVSSGSATHTPPSGSATTPNVSVATPLVTTTIGTLAVTGVHYVDTLCILSDNQRVNVRLILNVEY